MTDPIRAKIEEAKALGFTEQQLAFLEALLPDVYHAGQERAVEYILNHEDTHQPTSQRVETWQDVLKAARNAE